MPLSYVAAGLLLLEDSEPCDALWHMAEPLWALPQETKRSVCPPPNGTRDSASLQPATTVRRGINRACSLHYKPEPALPIFGLARMSSSASPFTVGGA